MGKKVLLIADDVEMNRKVIQKFLKSEYDILEAENGIEVLNILNKQKVDVLILDIIMPIMDGLEVLNRMSEVEEYRKIGILVATSTKEKTERTALSLGADDVVSKPYDPIVIKSRLRNIMAMKELKYLTEYTQQGQSSLELNRFYSQMEDFIGRIEKMAKIIYANYENIELVRQVAVNLLEETETAGHTLREREGVE